MTPEEAAMSESARNQASKSFLIGIVERHRRQFGTFGGEAGSYFEHLVEEALAPRVNWKSAIRKRFLDISGRDRSYRTPDRRFVSRGTYLAGNSAQVPEMLKNLKIAVDTSGSIGSEDLAVCLNQLEQLLKEFKCKDAELLFWDTQIRERVVFSDYRDILKRAKYSGGGGTDCNCVFAEFETVPYKNHKEKAPGYIIIFTDGYFGAIDPKFKKYGNHTIWVLPDYATTHFTAPFGLKSEFTAGDSKPRPV
jgi:predicted metal-dependent peptidase